ncbi:C5-sterol desaturase [Stereum hirsutum FP-91666 SS1]|uniref:C5-sterol desaturase n=1 Tax=Stereum hirsutum (strain FP-91666) TaxID=721885 RepID=UPI000440BD3C|nr:C5-sterol desaturase [Stereum hirsutum FP-91666 SS1]EIM91018.1 C5-sterol desaturase [Stereum hirsutum FP-91666 SS1]
MDLVLSLADHYLLDAVWARVLPLDAFNVPAHLSSFGKLPSDAAALPLPTWRSLVAHLPHPPLNNATAPYASSVAPLLSAWPRDYIPRQILSLSAITLAGIIVLYFLFAGLSYQYIFNHEMMDHPRFLKNQVKLEIQSSLSAFPGMTLLTLPWFQAEVMGYSKLYQNVDEYGWAYFILSVPWFLLFTDYGIYWVHRLLHHPVLYKYIHKPHHKWLIPTPFASHAFHPIDGYLQSVPYHLFIFIFPLQRHLYLALFVAVNFWSIFIHDSDMITGHFLEKVINGPAHHTLHHLYFTVNYGQYFTWADRWGGSYRQPESSLDPLLEVQAAKALKAQKAQ